MQKKKNAIHVYNKLKYMQNKICTYMQKYHMHKCVQNIHKYAKPNMHKYAFSNMHFQNMHIQNMHTSVFYMLKYA